MKASERARLIGRDFAGVLPRAHAAVASSDDWKPLSQRGARQLGEVVLDEVALSGMTLTAPPPKLERTIEACGAAATELSGLSVAEANAEPDPLRVKSIRRRRIGRLTYEQLTFEHDPRLPQSLAAEGLGGPATATVHLCRTGDDQRPWLVWVHGAGQGQPIDLLFSRARRIQDELGFNIALPVQPGPRCPSQRVADLSGHGSAEQCRGHDAGGVGGPRAGPVAAAAVQRDRGVRGVDGKPGRRAGGASRKGRRCSGLHADLRPQRDDRPTSRPMGAVGARRPSSCCSPTPWHRWRPSSITWMSNRRRPRRARLIVGAWHDRMAMREPAQVLHERWGGELYWHPGSHVGHLFAAGVQQASERFLRGVSDSRAVVANDPGADGISVRARGRNRPSSTSPEEGDAEDRRADVVDRARRCRRRVGPIRRSMPCSQSGLDLLHADRSS